MTNENSLFSDNLTTAEKTKKFGQSLPDKGKSSIKQISKLEIIDQDLE